MCDECVQHVLVTISRRIIVSMYPFQWDEKEYLSNYVVVLPGVLDVPTGTDKFLVVSS